MSHPSNELSESALDALIARERTRVVAPLSDWRTLATQLRAEGLLRTPEDGARVPYDTAFTTPIDPLPAIPVARRRGGFVRWGTRIVIGTALVGTGMIIGQGISIGRDVVAPAVQKKIAEVQVMTDTTPPKFHTPADAKKALVKAQNQYQRAAAYLAASDTTPRIVGGPEMYRERLALLEDVLAKTQARMEIAPGDPVINQYYQSAVGAREATLQQLGQTLPAGVQRY